jgi:hypothetical protein
MTEDDEPLGYIECDGELMGFWLPVGVHPDDLKLDWVGQ